MYVHMYMCIVGTPAELLCYNRYSYFVEHPVSQLYICGLIVFFSECASL